MKPPQIVAVEKKSQEKRERMARSLLEMDENRRAMENKFNILLRDPQIEASIQQLILNRKDAVRQLHELESEIERIEDRLADTFEELSESRQGNQAESEALAALLKYWISVHEPMDDSD